jgi:hypothetical protein
MWTSVDVNRLGGVMGHYGANAVFTVATVSVV